MHQTLYQATVKYVPRAYDLEVTDRCASVLVLAHSYSEAVDKLDDHFSPIDTRDLLEITRLRPLAYIEDDIIHIGDEDADYNYICDRVQEYNYSLYNNDL